VVDTCTVDECGLPEGALVLEPDVLVGPDRLRVVGVHEQGDAMQVHVVEAEPAEGANGVGTEAAVPVRFAEPDADHRGAGGRFDREERARTDRVGAVQPLDHEHRLDVVLLGHLDERLIARDRLWHDHPEALADLRVVDQVVEHGEVGRLVRAEPDERSDQRRCVLLHEAGAYPGAEVELLSGALVASLEPSAGPHGPRIRRQTT
jgi:hypothetical protein